MNFKEDYNKSNEAPHLVINSVHERDLVFSNSGSLPVKIKKLEINDFPVCGNFTLNDG